MYRTHTCGELTKKDIGKTVKLSGWVNSRRDHGGVIFIDLRDRYGITQCTCDPQTAKKSWDAIEKIRKEYVICIEGEVKKRPQDMVNKSLTTGEIEIETTEIAIVTEAKTPPFEIEWPPQEKNNTQSNEKTNVHEDIRLKYRYIDLRTKRMTKNIILRYKLIKYIRDYLDKENFLEIETPILTKSTPEGARDFIVPSRVHPGNFYALPQSPQQYKQLLMVAGLDRYFQIARCFRDEDQRGDRQPEFTQLDIEMSFVEREDILQLTEKLFKSVLNTLKEEKLTNKKFVHDKPWQRISHYDALLHYGTDRPDIRFDLKIHDVTDIFKETEFQVFKQTQENSGVIRAINAQNAGQKLTRKDIDNLTEFVQNLGAKGLAYIKIAKKGEGENEAETTAKIIINEEEVILQSPVTKFLSQKEITHICEKMDAKPDDIIFFCADGKQLVQQILGELRLELAKKLNLVPKDELAICWVIDFPFFESKREDGTFEPSQHIFAAPFPDDLLLLKTDPLKVRGTQYDLVMNGFEVAGGSIRSHDPKILSQILELAGVKDKKKNEFAHMLEAFTFGVPPHGGIAPGIDRIAMLLADEENIREVMAFPKNQKAQDLMMSAPSVIKKKQLDEVHITVLQ